MNNSYVSVMQIWTIVVVGQRFLIVSSNMLWIVMCEWVLVVNGQYNFTNTQNGKHIYLLTFIIIKMSF